MKALKNVTFILLVIGGLNWLLVGLFDFNLVTAIVGDNTVADIIYIIVGLSALYQVFTYWGRRDTVSAPQI